MSSLNSKTPVLTVVVPSYNVEAYLDKNLSSLGCENFKGKLEVIVVNDGSTDSTANIAEKYALKTPEIIKIVNKENGGHGSAVNIGMKLGTGKYFRIIDGDDWVDSNELSKLLDVLENSNEDIVISELTEVDMITGNEKRIVFPEHIYSKESYSIEDFVQHPEFDACVRLHSLNVKMDLIRKNNVSLLENCFYVDYLFLMLTVPRAKTIRVCDFNVYQYLVGNANQSVSYDNYVKRYSQHNRVLHACICFSNNFEDSFVLENYVKRKVIAMIYTQLNITLLFDKNRVRGRIRAGNLLKYLNKKAPVLLPDVMKRYKKVMLLHKIGVGSKGFAFINRIRGI